MNSRRRIENELPRRVRACSVRRLEVMGWCRRCAARTVSRSSRFPVEPDPETARYRPERAAADRLWRVLRKRSASGAVDATVVASAYESRTCPNYSATVHVLHRRDFVDTIAPLLKLSSSAPLRSNARRAAFVEPRGCASRFRSVGADVYQSLSADTTPVTGDCRYVISRRWLDDWRATRA